MGFQNPIPKRQPGCSSARLCHKERDARQRQPPSHVHRAPRPAPHHPAHLSRAARRTSPPPPGWPRTPAARRPTAAPAPPAGCTGLGTRLQAAAGSGGSARERVGASGSEWARRQWVGRRGQRAAGSASGGQRRHAAKPPRGSHDSSRDSCRAAWTAAEPGRRPCCQEGERASASKEHGAAAAAQAWRREGAAAGASASLTQGGAVEAQGQGWVDGGQRHGARRLAPEGAPVGGAGGRLRARAAAAAAKCGSEGSSWRAGSGRGKGAQAGGCQRHASHASLLTSCT